MHYRLQRSILRRVNINTVCCYGVCRQRWPV